MKFKPYQLNPNCIHPGLQTLKTRSPGPPLAALALGPKFPKPLKGPSLGMGPGRILFRVKLLGAKPHDKKKHDTNKK